MRHRRLARHRTLSTSKHIALTLKSELSVSSSLSQREESAYPSQSTAPSQVSTSTNGHVCPLTSKLKNSLPLLTATSRRSPCAHLTMCLSSSKMVTFILPSPLLTPCPLNKLKKKALYWYTVYNGNAGDITLQNFGLGRQVFTQDQRYSFTIHQYPF